MLDGPTDFTRVARALEAGSEALTVPIAHRERHAIPVLLAFLNRDVFPDPDRSGLEGVRICTFEGSAFSLRGPAAGDDFASPRLRSVGLARCGARLRLGSLTTGGLPFFILAAAHGDDGPQGDQSEQGGCDPLSLCRPRWSALAGRSALRRLDGRCAVIQSDFPGEDSVRTVRAVDSLGQAARPTRRALRHT